jgi:hypothetical protein
VLDPCCGPSTVLPGETTGGDTPGIACYTPDGCGCGPGPCAITLDDFICAVRQLLPEGEPYRPSKAPAGNPVENSGATVICDETPNIVGSPGCAGGEQLIHGGCCSDGGPIACVEEEIAPQLAVVDSFAAVLYGFVQALCKALCELDPCCAKDTLNRWAERFGIVRTDAQGCVVPFPDPVLSFLVCIYFQLKDVVFNLKSLEDLGRLFGARVEMQYAGAFNCSYYGHYWHMARNVDATCQEGRPAACGPATRLPQRTVPLVPCETTPDSINVLLCPTERIFPANCNTGQRPPLPYDPEYLEAFRWLLGKILPSSVFWCVYDCKHFDCPDQIPDAFTFTDVTRATVSTVYESNRITVLGITIPTPMTISGGEYSINGGPYASSPTTVIYFDSVRVRARSSSLLDTAVNVVVTIGGVSDTYSITTAPPLVITSPATFSVAEGGGTT